MHRNPVIVAAWARVRRLPLAACGLAMVGLLGGFTLAPEWRLSNRRSELLRDDWRFHLGDVAGAEASRFDDSAWQTVDLPHDWSIAGPRAADAATGMGGGYTP